MRQQIVTASLLELCRHVVSPICAIHLEAVAEKALNRSLRGGVEYGSDNLVEESESGFVTVVIDYQPFAAKRGPLHLHSSRSGNEDPDNTGQALSNHSTLNLRGHIKKRSARNRQ